MQVTMHLYINGNGNTNSHNTVKSKTFNSLQGDSYIVPLPKKNITCTEMVPTLAGCNSLQ